MSINSVVISGRVGGDPDVKYFEGGKVVANFSVAVSLDKENSDWYSIEAWGKTAELCANYVRKGGLIGVTGSLKTQTWKDKETGKDRSKVVILANRIELLGSKKDSEEAPQSTSKRAASVGAADADDIPF